MRELASMWAATTWSRNGHVFDFNRINYDALQWGRDHAVAESRRRSASSPPTARFNGAAANGGIRCGDTIHRFLAADDPQRPRLERLAMARQLTESYGVTGVLEAESMVEESDAFQAFVEQRWPGTRWRREVPVSAELDSNPTRRISGVIDLLLETSTGATWRAKARDHAPQLALYAEALRLTTGASHVECWLHLPVAGALLAISPK
jgi:hypothetical protein